MLRQLMRYCCSQAIARNAFSTLFIHFEPKTESQPPVEGALWKVVSEGANSRWRSSSQGPLTLSRLDQARLGLFPQKGKGAVSDRHNRPPRRSSS